MQQQAGKAVQEVLDESVGEAAKGLLDIAGQFVVVMLLKEKESRCQGPQGTVPHSVWLWL